MSDGPEQKVDQPAYFGGSEISSDVRRSGNATDANAVDPIGAEALSPDESLLSALHAAERFDSSGFYKTGRERLTPTLVLAYSLSVEIRKGGKNAIQVAIDRLSPARQRKISASKVELIALELTAKPQNVSQRKLCSSHASILKVAREERVSKEQFAEWLRGQKIKDCRRGLKKGPCLKPNAKSRLNWEGETGQNRMNVCTLNSVAGVFSSHSIQCIWIRRSAARLAFWLG